jgi:hypothetical protein
MKIDEQTELKRIQFIGSLFRSKRKPPTIIPIVDGMLEKTYKEVNKCGEIIIQKIK